MGRRAISMVTEPLATRGSVFQPILSPKCIGCEFFSVCIGTLRPLVSYRVLATRKHFNLCPALAERMQVVEVEELPFRVILDIRVAIPGASVRYSKPACDDEARKKYPLECDPVYVEEGEKITVLRRVSKVSDRLCLCEVEAIGQPSPRLWILAKHLLAQRRPPEEPPPP
jgi:uncharacterized protein (UPF0179 family)